MENDTSASAGDWRKDSTKTVVVGAGPVGALAALYAAQRGHTVEVYELRAGMCVVFKTHNRNYRPKSDMWQISVMLQPFH